MSKDDFTIKLFCKNCHHWQEFALPVGTRVLRAPILGYDDSETRVIYPDGKHGTLKCQICKIGNVA